MKKFLYVLILFPFFAFAQEGPTDTTGNVIVVSEDVNECINKIHNNPDAIKLFLRNLAQNPEKMRETYQRLVNDPEVRELVDEIRNNFRAENENKRDKQY